jgi:hypothetical protein
VPFEDHRVAPDLKIVNLSALQDAKQESEITGFLKKQISKKQEGPPYEYGSELPHRVLELIRKF